MEEMIRKMEESNAGVKLQHGSIGLGNESEEKEKKVPRNELCPCGSGKKFKQCCGKSGPKKGILA